MGAVADSMGYTMDVGRGGCSHGRAAEILWASDSRGCPMRMTIGVVSAGWGGVVNRPDFYV